MGNSQDTPAHVVELRLEHPEVPEVWAGESLELFAVIHTGSDNARRYKAWTEPHIVGLLADDVITVSIFAAKSKWHFENMQCDEYAELYVPWSVLHGQLQPGIELTFSLGVQRGVHWLGHGASLPDYVDAFFNAHSITEADPSAPHVKMGVRLVEHFVEGYENLHEVPGGLMGMIHPTEAEAVVGHRPADAEANGATHTHVSANPAASGVPQIPASARLFGSRQSLGSRPWDAASLMAEIQSITKGNMELTSSYDEQIRQLEAKIAERQKPVDPAKVEEAQKVLRQRHAEHEALEAECDRLRGTVTSELGSLSELGASAEVDDIVVAKLRIKEQLQLDEINQCRRMLTRLQKQHQKQQKRQQQQQRPVPPDNEERARSSRPQPQQPRQPQQPPRDATGSSSEAASQEALRRGARRLREQLRRAEEEKREAEEELTRLQVEQERSNMDPPQDPNEVKNLGDTLAKELRRSQRRVDSLDGKIQQLRQVVDDIRQEASMMVEDIPGPARSQHVPSALLTELQEAVQHRHQQVQQMQESEERLRRERSEARKALEAAKVQTAVLEAKLRLVAGSSST